MIDRQNRTIICSVLFVDIVEYSRAPVAQQLEIRTRVNALISEALQGFALNDRVVLDTGDGAAISFLGDPEDALFMALALREAIAEEPATNSAFKMRFGINLGPVRLVKDINGRPNILGDGINVAQRIMSFSEPGQILVSRSYYEVVSRLSDEYSQMFHYEGSRTDKHVREHAVYVVDGTTPIKRPAAVHNPSVAAKARGSIAAYFDSLILIATKSKDYLRRKLSLITLLAVVAILATVVVLSTRREKPDATNTDTQAAALQPASSEKKFTQPVDTVQTAALPEGKEALPAETSAAAPAASKKEAVSRGPAVVSLAISPWGDVYVDGEKRGVSPPLRNLQVTPGRHNIEIKNTTFPSYVETFYARLGGETKIKHKFIEKK